MTRKTIKTKILGGAVKQNIINEFDPNNLSIVKGCLETDEVEWVYVNKIYYMGKPLKFEPLEHDLKIISEKFKLIS